MAVPVPHWGEICNRKANLTLCRLHIFHQRQKTSYSSAFISTLKMLWVDFITNTEILDLARATSVEFMLQNTWSCSVRQVGRIEYYYLLKTLLFRELVWPIVTKGSRRTPWNDPHHQWIQPPLVGNRQLTGHIKQSPLLN